MNNYVFKTEHSKNYKTISLFCVNDPELSWKAKGLHTYFISRPPNWKINKEDLMKKAIDGDASIRSGIKELIDKGYVARILKRTNKNQIKSWGFFTFEQPRKKAEILHILQEEGNEWELYSPNKNNSLQQFTDVDKQHLENTHVKTQQHNNKDISNKENNNKESFSYEKDIMSADKEKDFLSKRKPVKNNPIKQETKEILAYWENSGLKFPKDKETSCYKKNEMYCIKLLDGTLYDKIYTKKQILLAIDNFRQAAFNADYLPVHKEHLQKSYFHDFVMNAFAKEKSYFKKYLEEKPKLFAGYKNDLVPLNPIVLKMIIDHYGNNILGVKDNEWSPKEMNDFVQSANKTVSFFNKNKMKFTSIGFTVFDLTKRLCEIMISNGNGIIFPSHFASDSTFKIKLPQYLLKKGLIASSQ